MTTISSQDVVPHSDPKEEQGFPASTSTTLLRRVRTRDAEAWRRLADLYGPLVYRWCRDAGLQDGDAADVVQEVFRTVIARMAGFHRPEDRSGFRAWLRAITRHKIGDFFRRIKQRPKAQGGTDAMMRMQQVPQACETSSINSRSREEELLARHGLQVVRDEFEDRTWRAFWSVAVKGRSVADVAADFEMTVHAVYKAKSRVLCRLRRELRGFSSDR
jgi:RNA polymerase sigma-70 factor (ECF subfamily)